VLSSSNHTLATMLTKHTSFNNHSTHTSEKHNHARALTRVRRRKVLRNIINVIHSSDKVLKASSARILVNLLGN